ncbi:MAG: hypothetical protein GY932_11180 [Arcobacter sp.]|nr:hypothetical protein [Arcobacter sp.]
MNTIKTHTANRKKVTITRFINGRPEKTIYKGITLDQVPEEYTKWFTYKGLTFITR